MRRSNALTGLVMLFIVSSLLAANQTSSQDANKKENVESSAKGKTVESDQSEGYRIDQPGTITFTVGVKIKGKVEKPQVVIFLPKEKPIYRELQFDRSFKEDLMDPLPFTPITE